MVTITSSVLKASVSAVRCAVLCTLQVCLICSKGGEPLCFVSLHFDRFGGILTYHPRMQLHLSLDTYGIRIKRVLDICNDKQLLK